MKNNIKEKLHISIYVCTVTSMWFFGNKVVLFCGRPFEVNPTDFIVHDWCIKKKRARIEKKK